MTTTLRINKVSTLAKLERMRNSRNGNPRFKMTFDNGLSGQTSADDGQAYAVTDSWVGKPVKFDWSMPRKNAIISNFELVGETQ